MAFINPNRVSAEPIGLFDNSAYKLSITSQITKLRRMCEHAPANQSQLWDRTYPSYLLDAVEALFRDVIVPHSSAAVYFTYEQGDEQYSLVVKIAAPAEFLKSFKDAIPYFQVSIKVETDDCVLDTCDDCLVALDNQQGERGLIGLSDEYVPVKPFSGGSQRKVIDNAIAYLHCNVNSDFDSIIETGNTGEGASFIDIEIPFGMYQKLAINILYDNPETHEE